MDLNKNHCPPLYQTSFPEVFSDHMLSTPPHLHPALTANTTNIRYDLRKSVQEGILFATYPKVAIQPAFAQPTREVRIISRVFPWSIDICVPTGSVVTCNAIFEGLYKALQEPMEDTVWATAVPDKSKKEAIKKAADARKAKETRLKRIDWLGETTAFKGLERDKEYEKERQLYMSQVCKETWVIKLGKP